MSKPTPDQIRHDMDSPALNHVSLCAGYGGIDLGLRRAIPSLRTVAFAEIEGFACANLVAKMEAGQLDSAPIWTDLKTFPYGKFRGLVDILSGGYPCQPFSAAGQRRGKDDPRHLWPWIADGIAAMRPAVCFFENVEGHISLGLSDVIEDLAGMGYRTTWGIFSASEVGAPHQRKRVFILAHCNGERGLVPDWWHQSAEQVPICNGATWRDVWPSRPGQPQFNWEPPRVVGNARVQESGRLSSRSGRQEVAEAWQSSGTVGNADHGRQSLSLNARSGAEAVGGGQGDAQSADCCVGDPQSERPAARRPEHEGQPRQACVAGASGGLGDTANEGPSERRPEAIYQPRAVEESERSNARAERKAQPALGRDSDGSSGRMGDAELFTSSDNRTDELRLLGNGVIPAAAERAFRVLMEQLYAANT